MEISVRILVDGSYPTRTQDLNRRPCAGVWFMRGGEGPVRRTLSEREIESPVMAYVVLRKVRGLRAPGADEARAQQEES